MVSTRRIGEIYRNPEERRLALQIVAAHEMSHLLGLTIRNFNTRDFDFSITGWSENEIREVKEAYANALNVMKD